MRDDIQRLTDLIKYHYRIQAPALHSMHLFENAGRGIYRVERQDGPPWLLRAERAENPEEMAAWFARSAATLLYLEQQRYPAPRVIRTHVGSLTCIHQGWAALMLTFVQGSMIAYTSERLRALGTILGRLHKVSLNAAADASPPLPDARFRPGRTISRSLSALEAVSPSVPAEFQTLYDQVVQIFQEVDTWVDLPQTLVHCDCWSTNAIQSAVDQVILVDWDNAGIGLALLDLGYLLAACHLEIGVPCQQVYPERIRAVMHGYAQQRLLSPEEMKRLSLAIRFGGTYHVANSLLQVHRVDEGRRQQILAKMRSRYALAEQTAEIVG